MDRFSYSYDYFAMLRDQIQVFTSVLFQTNTYLIPCRDCTFVVDPFGTRDEIKHWTKHLLSEFSGKPVDLIFTHADYDHILAHDHIITQTKIAHVNFLKRDPRQIKSEAEDLRGFLYLDWPDWTMPQPTHLIEVDGYHEKIGLHFLLIPGHTMDGIAIWIEANQSLIVGDHLSLLEFPFIEYSPKDYEQSLKKLQELVKLNQVKYVFPGHGPAIEGATAILDRIDIDLQYLHLLGIGAFKKDETHKHISKNYRFHFALQAMHNRNIQRWSGWKNI